MPPIRTVRSNPLQSAVKSPRIQIVCSDSSGVIIGGTSTYPDLVPAGGKIRVDADVIVSVAPQACSAYIGAPTDWGEESTAAASPNATSASPAQTVGSAEVAFETWVKQFGDEDWKAQYETIVNAQREVISESEYVSCRTLSAAPSVSWVKVLSVTDAGDTGIPGTDESLPSTQVTAQVEVDGVKAPIDAHMYFEDGTWKWSMTEENIAGCRG